jgi:hypothetical protein
VPCGRALLPFLRRRPGRGRGGGRGAGRWAGPGGCSSAGSRRGGWMRLGWLGGLATWEGFARTPRHRWGEREGWGWGGGEATGSSLGTRRCASCTRASPPPAAAYPQTRSPAPPPATAAARRRTPRSCRARREKGERGGGGSDERRVDSGRGSEGVSKGNVPTRRSRLPSLPPSLLPSLPPSS